MSDEKPIFLLGAPPQPVSFWRLMGCFIRHRGRVFLHIDVRINPDNSMAANPVFAGERRPPSMPEARP